MTTQTFSFNPTTEHGQAAIVDALKKEGIEGMYKKIGRKVYKVVCTTDNLEGAYKILNSDLNTSNIDGKVN